MRIRAESQEEKRIASLLQEHLLTFPLAGESNEIKVIRHKGKIAVSYTTRNTPIHVGTTHFDLELREDICDILSMGIEEKHSSRGYGKALYKEIERFARTMYCEKMQTTPSGQGKKFWPRMGFDKPCEVGVEKLL